MTWPAREHGDRTRIRSFAEERPVELRVAADGQSLDLATSGSAMKAGRVRD
ncbi:MAG: hypothetical protein ABI650_12040 [Dokdonella sp.]